MRVTLSASGAGVKPLRSCPWAMNASMAFRTHARLFTSRIGGRGGGKGKGEAGGGGARGWGREKVGGGSSRDMIHARRAEVRSKGTRTTADQPKIDLGLIRGNPGHPRPIGFRGYGPSRLKRSS